MVVFNGRKVFSSRMSQVLSVFSATVSCIAGGMQYGWTSPVIPILQSKDTPVPIQKHDIVWIENSYMIGAFIGIPFTIYALNKFGRKNSILIAAAQNLVSWILTAFATTVEVIYVARIIQGFAGNTAFVSAPMYVAEISDKKIRGFLGAWVYLMMLIGIIIIYSVAPFVSIAMSSLVGAVFVIVQLVTFPFMPDSPYFLLLKNKPEAARKSLERLRSGEDIEAEMQEILAAVERQQSERGRLIDLFLIDSNRKALLIMTVLNGTQHFSSISVMVMNLHMILEDAASILTPSTAAIIFSVIMFLAASIASSMIDRTGRKIILSTSSFLTGISLATLASYFAIKNSGVDISSYTWVPVTAVMVYAGAFKYGLGMVPIVMTGELFPTSVKAMGMTFADAMYVIFSLVSVYLYQFLADAYGLHVPFIIFAVTCLLATAFIIYYIPETKGKTLEEIQFMLKGTNTGTNKEKELKTSNL